MRRGLIRFYEELNRFLPFDKRKEVSNWESSEELTVGGLIESFGIPLQEVDLVLVDGNSVDFGYSLNDGERVSVYPEFELLDISELNRLRPRPLRRPKFICDVHLRPLAYKLRILGFDTLYSPSYDDPEIISISLSEKRTILTKDKELLKRRKVERGFLIKDNHHLAQLRQVVIKFDLKGCFNPFTLCTVCNGPLVEIKKTDQEFVKIEANIPKQVLTWCDCYKKCIKCQKLYWQGSHYQKLLRLIDSFEQDCV